MNAPGARHVLEGGVYDSPQFRVWLTDDGILTFRVKKDAHITEQHLFEYIEVVEMLLGGRRKVPVLADLGEVRSATARAREVPKEDQRFVEITLRCAILVRHPIARVLGSVFVGLNRPPFPTKMFTDQEAALSWLRNP